jgi:hypothetical protein
MHFTLLNVGIELPAAKKDRLVTALKPALGQLIRTDFTVQRSVQTMRDQAKMRPLSRIMRDGSLILRIPFYSACCYDFIRHPIPC